MNIQSNEMKNVINQYEQGGNKLRLAIRGLTPEDLLWVPPADAGVGLWSIQQIVIHLQDSDLIGAARMKQMIAETNPQIVGYDESKFASELLCDEQSADDAMLLFDVNRRQFARVLRKLAPETFDRTGRHSERGEIKLGESLKAMVRHLDHHLKFVHEKRAKMGKEMW